MSSLTYTHRKAGGEEETRTVNSDALKEEWPEWHSVSLGTDSSTGDLFVVLIRKEVDGVDFIPLNEHTKKYFADHLPILREIQSKREFNGLDIQLVMTLTGESRERAIEGLEKRNGNIGYAILYLIGGQ